MNFSLLDNKTKKANVFEIFDENYHELINRKKYDVLIYCILGLSIISFLLNTFNFGIFLSGRFKSNFDRYLKIYTFNTMIINLHMMVSYLRIGLIIPSHYTLSNPGFYIMLIRYSKIISDIYL